MKGCLWKQEDLKASFSTFATFVLHVIEMCPRKWSFVRSCCGEATNHLHPCPVRKVISNLMLTQANILRPLGSDTPRKGAESTYEEGECLLELGDLIFSK